MPSAVHCTLWKYGLALLACRIAMLTVHGQSSSQCQAAYNCTACLLVGPACGWCFKQDVEMSAKCDLPDILRSKGCNDSIFEPRSEVEYIRNVPLQNADFGSDVDAVQLSPQALKIRLTPKRPANFTLKFRIAEDYPVDLYYLMDLSFSMKDDKTVLTGLGVQLRDALLSITRNVRLGFGGFVDKPVMPYISVRASALQNPCGPENVCVPAFGFVNRLPLTNDTAAFVEKVAATDISGNQDGAEGGFDALMQSVVCQNDIGWREQARKLLVFATDDTCHVSGDGKLAGILEPNDGLCHMENNSYTHSALLDYPSIGQIGSIIKANHVNIIFAVASQYSQHYSVLTPLLQGSVVAVLNQDSSNIVNLVKENYRAIISKVELKTRGLVDQDDVAISFKSACRGSTERETTWCDGLKIGETVSFNVQLSLNSCPAAGGSVASKVMEVYAVGLNEKLSLDLVLDCSCDCKDEEESSSKCSGQGKYSCGVCYCSPGFVGSQCECDTAAITLTADEVQKQCIRPSPGAVGLPCSSRGSCTACGKCECNCLQLAGGRGSSRSAQQCGAGERYTGDFCECNPRGCNSYNDLLCGGRGTCQCDSQGNNYCKCNEQYANGLVNACDCVLSKATCKVDNSSVDVCNGKGECACGVCRCTDDCYTGPTCSVVKPECSSGCVDFRPCVECQQRGSGCKDYCSTLDMSVTERIDDSGPQTCRYTDEERCEHTYAFSYDSVSGQHRIRTLKDKKCPLDLLIPLVAGIGAAIVFLGLLAIAVWKIVTTVHDRREYERFEKDRQKAKWNTGQNPLYQQATSTFKNPTYAGR